MSDAFDRGITVTEMMAMDEPVDLHTHSATAFVGRALRGPLNTPVLIRSPAEFSKRFGGVWPKSSMGPAVQQFFDHGGQRLYVVRVANGASSTGLSLRTDSTPLRLAAVDPGSSESLRVSVDYDRLSPDDDEHFNLTVQRMAPGESVLVDQEIHDRLSCDEGSANFIVDRLRSSALIQAVGPMPAGRPQATIGPHVHRGDGYVRPDRRGDDGAELSDYDLIGSANDKTGIFSLDGIDDVDLLYLPPIGRSRDIGPAATMAADLYCRRRGAMLIVDPPRDWVTDSDALQGIAGLGFASPNMLTYFPRVIDREGPESGPRAAGGAVAGLMSRADTREGPWCDLAQISYALKPRYQPAERIDASSVALLEQEGVNVLAALRGSRVLLHGGVTLARQSACDRQFASLPVRRLCLYISSHVGRATRWAVFGGSDIRVAERVRSQVHAFLSGLHSEGAFESERLEVYCQALRNGQSEAPLRGVTIDIGFVPVDHSEMLWLSLHQDVEGCRASTAAFAPSVDRS